MKLWGLSDLHLHHRVNRETIAALPYHGDDWLLLVGDIGEREEHLRFVFDTLGPRFGQLFWVPGNHELWTVSSDPLQLEGVARYDYFVALCREYGVLTPEDPWPLIPGTKTRVCPMFLLYDYSFRPAHVARDEVVLWAQAKRQLCADENYLRPAPHPSADAWCDERVRLTEARLDALDPSERTILVNHWPLRQDVVRMFTYPRFTPWCGTRRTTDWHTRYRAEAVVSGHLHMRATDWRDGVRFEEVSLGYPRHWRKEVGATGYLRQIWPGPAEPEPDSGPDWHH